MSTPEQINSNPGVDESANLETGVFDKEAIISAYKQINTLIESKTKASNSIDISVGGTRCSAYKKPDGGITLVKQPGSADGGAAWAYRMESEYAATLYPDGRVKDHDGEVDEIHRKYSLRPMSPTDLSELLEVIEQPNQEK